MSGNQNLLNLGSKIYVVQTSFASTDFERSKVEEKKVEVQKQKFEFLLRGCSSTPISKGLKNRLSSPELLNVSGITIKPPHLVTQDVNHMLASAEGKITSH